MKNLRFLLILMAALSLFSYIGVRLLNVAASEERSDNIVIVTSFYPMYIASMNLLEDVDGVELFNLSEPQTGCLHDYTLTPEDMKLLSAADVLVLNGGGIEAFLPDVDEAYPDLLQLDTSAYIKEQDAGIEDNAHFWMSVRLYMLQIEALEQGLSDMLFNVEGADETDARVEQIRKNALAYLEKLSELSEQQEEVREKLSGDEVILFHEAYEYVAYDYGLDVTYLMDLDEERQISAGEVADVMDAIEKDDVRLVLAEEEYGGEMGSRIKENTQAAVIYLDTIVRGTEDYERDAYINRMQNNIDLISEYADSL